MEYATTDEQQASLPFQGEQSFGEVKRGDGTRIYPEIHCRKVKGFFVANGCWTCYRRNYFSLECSYSFSPQADPNELYLVRPDGEPARSNPEQIQSFAVCLSACVSGTPERHVELLQRTPKRDKGPSLSPPMVKLLPISTEVEQGISHSTPIVAGTSFPKETYHLFERIQFQDATANNGKRRAAQQYFIIAVELWVDTHPEGNPDPTWVKVAQRSSAPLVIRGRSPGQYRTDVDNIIESGWRTTQRYAPDLPNPLLPLARWDEKKNAPTDAERSVAFASASPAHTEQTSPEVERKESENDQMIKDEKRSVEVVLDDSSVSSVENPGIGSRGASSRSSFSSLHVEPSIADRFARLLLESEGVQALSEGCFAIENEDRVERNICRLLKILAINLKSAASDQAESVVASLLLRHAKRVASSIRRQSAPGKSSLTSLKLLGQTAISKENAIDNFLLQLASTQGSMATSEEQGVASVEDVPTNEETFNAAKTEDADESEDMSEEEAGEPLSEPLSMEIERGAHFLSNSEALVDFREGLIDFRVAVENARYNQVLHEKDKEMLVDPSWFRRQASLVSNLPRLVWPIPVLRWWRLRDLRCEIFHKLQKALRPSVEPGTRRIEWTCDCGDQLYADFSNADSSAIDALEVALNQKRPAEGSEYPTGPKSGTVLDHNLGNRNSMSPSDIQLSRTGTTNIGESYTTQNVNQSTSRNERDPRPKYFAVCIPAGGMYKTLSEIDISRIKSDAELFMTVKNIYQNGKGDKARWRTFLKPVSVEFVQFSLWNTRRGYVSICDRPRCVPPKDDFQYDFCPRPMAPLPPVPPEIFMHYLEHKGTDFDPQRYVWTPRLPKRKERPLITCDVPTYGWGIYIREGPNRVVVFWVIIITVFASVLLAILWASIRGDVQGGTGLGTLLLALPSVIMAAFMFRISETI